MTKRKEPDDGYKPNPSEVPTHGIVPLEGGQPAAPDQPLRGVFDNVMSEIDNAAGKFFREWEERERLKRLRWRALGASVREIGILWSAFALLDYFLPDHGTQNREAVPWVAGFTTFGLVLTAIGLFIECSAESELMQADAGQEKSR